MVVIQASLNRISQNYPAIPKVPVADGIFGSKTEASVKAFQKIFDLTPDGIVGQKTWYALVRIYTAVTKLSELRSQGQQFYSISWAPPNALQLGDTGEKVKLLQYMLAMLSEYIPEIPPVSVDGIYGKATRAAVLAAQRRFRLPETGVVDPETWQAIYGQFSGIENTTLRSEESFPVSGTMAPAAVPAGNFTRSGTDFGSKTLYARSSTLQQFPGRDLSIGSRDAVQKEVVR